MSEVINPPDYYFTGINFNPAFYADDTGGGGGLSEAIANTLYLRKTVPDTANVVETFTKDIICTEAITAKDDLVATTASVFMSCTTSNPKIDLMADTGRSLSLRTTSIQVGASSPLDIATYIDVDLNVGTGGRTGLGTGPSPFIIHNYSDANNCLAGNNVHLNNGTNNLSNTNIHNGTSSGGAVNIMTGTGSTGAVNIGVSGVTTTINHILRASQIQGLTATSLMYVGNNLTTTGSLLLGNTGIRTKNQGIFETASIRTPATNGQLTICTDLIASGSVDIGTSASTTNLFGTAKTNTLDALSATATMNLASSLTSGTINLMTNNVVSGILNLMYNAVSSATGTINIGQYNTSPAPSRTTTNIRGDINIGGSATETSIIGTAKCDAIAGIATTGTQSLYATKTAGELTCLAAGTGVLNVKGSGIKFDTLSTDNSTGIQGLYTNKTAGTLSIATAQTAGSISIGGVGSGTTVNGSLNVLNNLQSNFIGVTSNPADSTTALQFQRNGQFTIGIAPTANPKLVMGVNTGSSPGTEVQILSLGTGTVYSNGGTLTNTNPSDETLKKNITSLDASIDDLNPVQYEWNNPKMGVGIKYGFLANEVIEIFPDICSTWKTDEDDEEDGIPKVKLGMDTVSLIPIMVSAMKKMKQDYDAKLSKLEARLLDLDHLVLQIAT